MSFLPLRPPQHIPHNTESGAVQSHVRPSIRPSVNWQRHEALNPPPFPSCCSRKLLVQPHDNFSIFSPSSSGEDLSSSIFFFQFQCWKISPSTERHIGLDSLWAEGSFPLAQRYLPEAMLQKYTVHLCRAEILPELNAPSPPSSHTHRVKSLAGPVGALMTFFFPKRGKQAWKIEGEIVYYLLMC